MSIVEDTSGGYLRVKLRLTGDSTHIHLETTAFTTDELIGIARSLVPLPPDLPGLDAASP
jgi:hypothetical protein